MKTSNRCGGAVSGCFELSYGCCGLLLTVVGQLQASIKKTCFWTSKHMFHHMSGLGLPLVVHITESSLF